MFIFVPLSVTETRIKRQMQETIRKKRITAAYGYSYDSGWKLAPFPLVSVDVTIK
jgi:hypothetical protein